MLDIIFLRIWLNIHTSDLSSSACTHHHTQKDAENIRTCMKQDYGHASLSDYAVRSWRVSSWGERTCLPFTLSALSVAPWFSGCWYPLYTSFISMFPVSNNEISGITPGLFPFHSFISDIHQYIYNVEAAVTLRSSLTPFFACWYF